MADLFAGSGAMGIEALSRGATKAVFVDRSPVAVEAVRANLASTGLAGEQATVVAGRSGVMAARAAGHFDVVFVDPPYAFTAWDGLLDKPRCRPRRARVRSALEVPVSWEIVKSKRYGGTLVTVVRPAGEPDEEQKGIS